MIFMLFLILLVLCLPYFGLGARANTIIAVIALVLGIIVVFLGWDGGFSVRVRVD